MAVNTSAAYATYPNSVELGDVVQALCQRGFSPETVFMLISPTHPIATSVRQSTSNPFEGNPNATDRIVKWLSDFGAVVIPTFGFFVRSREFLRTLLEECNSRAPKRHGTLDSLGFSREDASRFERQVRNVGALLYVSCPEHDQTQRALELFRATGAEESGLLRSHAAFGASAGAA